ncbi:exported hypothetical protein [Candidatus Desulfosporosinus infrequens]|uniref:Uncharacterized protein n=1 Tax=Candidatus Desulfosporosinus infrequens TaxID=2043169 RepID=A0A2U3LGN8_9FIRM|nr:exported hypothetical protein [Candidatus Desulfosporosinus infrequens]
MLILPFRGVGQKYPTYSASIGAWRAILTGSVTVSASDITLTTVATN